MLRCFGLCAVWVAQSYLLHHAEPTNAFVVPPSLPYVSKVTCSLSIRHHSFNRIRGELSISQAKSSSAEDDGDDDDSVPVWQSEGEEIIRNAAMEAGASADEISVVWKPSRVIVTISAASHNLVLSTDTDDDDNDDDIDDDLDEGFEDEIEQQTEEEEVKGLDITAIARAINAALDDEEGTVGYYVAFNHEIEVTTPGASDTIQGKVMFEAYKGFDVILEGTDAKSGKRKVVEGKLVERDDKVTKINVKGRIVKMKNENVESVKLPKAKKEKGVR